MSWWWWWWRGGPAPCLLVPGDQAIRVGRPRPGLRSQQGVRFHHSPPSHNIARLLLPTTKKEVVGRRAVERAAGRGGRRGRPAEPPAEENKESAQSEAIRAISCSGSALYHNPR